MEEALNSILEATARFEYLIAKKEYEKLVHLMKLDVAEGDRFRQCQLKRHEKLIKNILHKCDEIDGAIEACAQEHDDWTVGSSAQGIVTKYMIDNQGFINLKVEGTMENLPLYSQMVVIWEVTLYHLWVPYCSESRILKSFDNSEFITTMTLNPPFGITRDIVVHAFGANCLTEQNSVVLVTKSLSDSVHDKDITADVTIPPVNKGFFSDRVHLHYLYCVNTMTSPTSTKFTAVMKLDPKLSLGLPASILSWFINQLASVAFPLMRKQAVYLSEADPYNSSYTNQIRDSSAFYVDFLLPLFRAYVQKQGWSQPVIRCLYEKGIPRDGVDYSTPFIPIDCLPPTTSSSSSSLSPSSLKKKKMGAGGEASGGNDSSQGGQGQGQGQGQEDQSRHFSSSGSDISADFYSCLDDEEHFLERKFSYDQHQHLNPAASFPPRPRVSSSSAAAGGRGRVPLFGPDEGQGDGGRQGDGYGHGSRHHQVLVGVGGNAGVEEPFLAERGRRRKCSSGEGKGGGGGEEEESLDGSDGCCGSTKSCCRWLLCCSGL